MATRVLGAVTRIEKMAVDYDGSLLIDGQRVLEDYYDEDYEPDQEGTYV